MLHLYKTRKRARKFLFYSLIVLGFLTCWCALTVVILYVQDLFLGSDSGDVPVADSYNKNGVQVVVGHYNGNLPKEKLANLTDEELNANNYNPIDGWGEYGKAVRLEIKEELKSEDTFGINQFNLYISDRIPINRTLPDIRKRQCREKMYPGASELPTTSVIIVYHNEAYSTLLRTITSVVNRSPKPALEEIILVDDKSNRTFLRQPLNDFVKTLSVRVKILRATSRVGLIRARMMGAQEATGDVLTFLDSHCECTEGWLEPLLARIRENRKAVVCPIIDVINDRTFQYQKGIELFRGGFNWNLQFRWYALPSSVIKARAADPTAPIESPTMAGGLFSIDRRYFEELGTYDPGMDIWGGENLEISFRIWQCGGRVEILPCSHVGHIFRKASPHDFPGKSSGKILNNNLYRVAEVWMDDWKHLFYKTAPQALAMRTSVDVSERIELRKKLACKSFRWYLNNIFTDHFLPEPEGVFGRMHYLGSSQQNATCLQWVTSASGIKKADTADCREGADEFPRGQIGLVKDGYCIVSRPGEAGHKNQLTMSKCTLGFDLWQLWIFTKEGRLRSDEHMCLSAIATPQSTSPSWIVQLKECGGYEMEYWDYNVYRRSFTHRQSGLCLDKPEVSLGGSKEGVHAPSLRRCSRGGIEQQWLIKPVQWLPSH